MAKIDDLIQLTKLHLSPEEKEIISPQLDEAWEAVKELEKVGLQGVAKLTHPTGLRNVTRPDKVTPSLSQAEALSNAKRTYQGYFVVDRILAHKDD